MLDPGRFPELFAALVAYFRHHLPVRLHAQVEDLAQETLAATLSALEKAGREVRDPEHYLRGVARHKLAEALRRDHRRRVVPLDEVVEASIRKLVQQVSVEQGLAQAEMERAVRRALRTLPPVEAELLRLRFWENLSNEEASRRLGLAPEQGSRLRYVALQRIRDHLKGNARPRRRRLLEAVR